MRKQVFILGAGQLARMMAIAGAPLNIQTLALDVNTGHVVHPISGMRFDGDIDKAIDWCDVITAEFEHIPHDILEHCGNSGKLQPSVEAIKAGGDRHREKQLLDAAGIKSAQYAIIKNRAGFDQAIAKLDLPLVFKSTLGGYDGKGQWRLNNADNIEAIWSALETCLLSSDQQAILAEQKVSFNREVSVIGVRNYNGDMQVYPITENRHSNGILSTSITLENAPLQDDARQIFVKLAEALNYVGVLAIELFDVGGQLLVNEIAPRVHNSGHWSIQGAETSQFENHLRAICDIPLGNTDMARPTAMINLLGVDEISESVYSMVGHHVHWYGKEKRAGRKMGHINICPDSESSLKKAVDTFCNEFTVHDL